MKHLESHIPPNKQRRTPILLLFFCALLVASSQFQFQNAQLGSHVDAVRIEHVTYVGHRDVTRQLVRNLYVDPVTSRLLSDKQSTSTFPMPSRPLVPCASARQYPISRTGISLVFNKRSHLVLLAHKAHLSRTRSLKTV
jgi:hypothetical protein